MTATQFNPGTMFSYCGDVFMVVKKTSIPCDQRFKAVWITRVPQTAAEAEKWDGAPDGWFALTELQEWRKTGVVYNIINPKN